MRLPFAINDEQAMWRVQHEGDHGAFAQLVQRWERPIQRLCSRMLGDLHRGEDMAQEAFARVFAQRHSFQPGLRFSTWLWRIAINLCQDELRRRQRRPETRLIDGCEVESTGADEWEGDSVASFPGKPRTGDGLSERLDSGQRTVLETRDMASGADSSRDGSEPRAEPGRAPDQEMQAVEQAEWIRRGLSQVPEIYRTVLILRHYEGLKFAEIASILGIPDGTVKSRMATGLNQLRQVLEASRDTKLD